MIKVQFRECGPRFNTLKRPPACFECSYCDHEDGDDGFRCIHPTLTDTIYNCVTGESHRAPRISCCDTRERGKCGIEGSLFEKNVERRV